MTLLDVFLITCWLGIGAITTHDPKTRGFLVTTITMVFLIWIFLV